MTYRYLLAIASLLFLSLRSEAATSAPTIVPVGIATTLQELDSNSAISAGDYVRHGVQLALKHYSERLKKKNLTIKLEEFDYSPSDLEALKAAKKAAASDVVAVHGYDYSSHALIAAPIHQEAGLPMVTPTATADRLAALGKYVHLVSFTNSYQAEMLARYAYKTLKARRVLTVAAKDCAYCQDLEHSFAREFQKLGGLATGSLPVLSNDQDFSKLTRQALDGAKPDLIFLPNYEVLSARIISSFLTAGINVPFLGGDGWTTFGERVFRNVMADRSFQAFSAGHWHPTSRAPGSKRFVADFQAAYGTMPNDTAALSYDGMCLILEAIMRAKVYTREAVETELSQIAEYKGATGNISLAPGKASARNIYLLGVSNKGFSLVQELTGKNRESD